MSCKDLMALVPAQCGHMWLAFQIPSDVYSFLQTAVCVCVVVAHVYCYFSLHWHTQLVFYFIF